ncbi:MAG TPA: hypothetical protein PLO61_00190 [Fimbriimonadaceae bacterium]|nr:hypothetical protein [Fimbriimonadaceae bacterium]HRJ33500.1 hypothetical protein [Fimbriimonadaceae bacterium]
MTRAIFSSFCLIALAAVASAQVTVRYNRTGGSGSTPVGYNNVVDDCTLGVAGGTRVRDFSFSWNLSASAQNLRIIVSFYDTCNLGATGSQPVNANLISSWQIDRLNQASGTRITSAGLGTVDFIIPDNTCAVHIYALELTAGGVPTGNLAPNFRVRMMTSSGSDVGSNDETKFWRTTANTTSLVGSDVVNTSPNALYFSISGEVPPPQVTGRFEFGQNSYFGGTIPTTALIDFKDVNYTVLATQSVPLGSNGEFSVLKPSAVTVPYRISYRKQPWLRATYPQGPSDPLIPLDAPFNVGVIQLITGDIDGDNEITNFDYSLWAASNGTATGNPLFNADADLDGDGELTNFDYSLWATNNGLLGDN